MIPYGFKWFSNNYYDFILILMILSESCRFIKNQYDSLRILYDSLDTQIRWIHNILQESLWFRRDSNNYIGINTILFGILKIL